MDRVQLVIDRGLLEEDPDGVLWLTAKARDIIDLLQADKTLMTNLKKKAVDKDDERVGFWTCVYLKCCPKADLIEVSDAVLVLTNWQEGAMENRLDEWSMGLRFR